MRELLKMKREYFFRYFISFITLTVMTIQLCSCSTTQQETAVNEFKLAKAEKVEDEPITRLAFITKKQNTSIQTIAVATQTPQPENIETAAGEVNKTK